MFYPEYKNVKYPRVLRYKNINMLYNPSRQKKNLELFIITLVGTWKISECSVFVENFNTIIKDATSICIYSLKYLTMCS